MSRNRWIVMVALVALGAVAGCSSRRDVSPDQRVTVIVDNQNFYDATVYLRWYSDRRRLGSVTGYTRKEFDAGWRAWLKASCPGRTSRSNRTPPRIFRRAR